MSFRTLSLHELLVMFSTLQDHPVLSVRYPAEDRNEKSRRAVTHALREQGHLEAAQAIDDGVELLVADDVAEAVAVREVIELNSAALSAHLYWQGEENQAVVDRVVQARQNHLRNLSKHRA